MCRTSLLTVLVLTSLPAFAEAPVTLTADQRMQNTWSNKASFFFGVRGGVAVPPGAMDLAPNVSLEMGVAVPTGFGIGIRGMWMNAPPGAPALGLNAATFGFGALADFRYYFETIDPLIIYPTISVGFLAGPDAVTHRNAVLPLFNPGVGAKVRFGNVYMGFEFGVSGFTIPFVALTLGFEGDSRAQKEAKRLNVTTEELLTDARPTPATARVSSPVTPSWTGAPVVQQPPPLPAQPQQPVLAP